jgi:hypothetical protein
MDVNEDFSCINRERIKAALSWLYPHPLLLETYSYSFTADLEISLPRKQKHLIIIRRDGCVLSGWRRVLAAKNIGWTHIGAEIQEDLPTKEDEEQFILDANKSRVKTHAELYHEIRKLHAINERQQGFRSDLKGTEAFDRRKAIGIQLDIKEWVVDALLIIGDYDIRQLDTIQDKKGHTLSAILAKVRNCIKENGRIPDFTPVERMDLSRRKCACCNTINTPRIVEIDGRLLFENDIN